MQRERTGGLDVTSAPAVGAVERHLAVSSLAQQVSQVAAVLCALVAVTVLARRLSLSEFGTYGLLVSLTTYVLFLQASIETAAIKAIAEARDQNDRDGVFSTAITLYGFTGLAAGVLVGAGGMALLGLFHIPASLHHEARLAVLALAVVTAAGWPLKVFNDVLRGSQRLVHSAAAEIAAFVAIACVLVVLALLSAPLWLLVGVGASGSILIGAASAITVLALRLPYHYRRERVTQESVRGFLRLSSYLSLMGLSGLVIYSIDRLVLASFRSAATVALYEGPVRAHNLVQQVHGAFAVPVLPASSRFVVTKDTARMHDLLLRGTRYTLAAVVPLAIVFMTLARPILHVWLGARFDVAATAMTLLVAYWLVNANTVVAGTMLLAAGRVRWLTGYAAAVALLNLVLSLSLTPSLGLNGVVLGTSISYLIGFPFFLATVLSALPVTLAELAREAWLPAYVTGAAVAAALVGVRLAAPLDRLPQVVAAAALGLVSYWAIYYVVWLRPSERLLVRGTAAAVFRR